MLEQVLNSRSDFGIKWRQPKKVAILTAGSTLNAERSKAALLAGVSVPEAINIVRVHVSHIANFDFLSPEGVDVWKPKLESTKGINLWIGRAHLGQGASFLRALKGFNKVRAKAKNVGTSVVLVVSADTMPEGIELEDYCDEFIRIEECEAEPSGEQSFYLECTQLSQLDPNAGRVMGIVNASTGARRYEPFIAKALYDRAIRRMRGAGFTYAQIGQVVKKDKSTVLRNLEGWPLQKLKVDEHWLAQVREHFEASGGISRDAKEKSRAVTDDEEEDYEEDEED